MPVSGPHRIYVERVPAGVRVDVAEFVCDLLVNLAQDFAEDPNGVVDDLQQLAKAASSATTQTSHGNDDASSVHERDERAQRLLDAIGGGAVVVYGSHVGALGRALIDAGQTRVVPAQHAGGEVA